MNTTPSQRPEARRLRALRAVTAIHQHPPGRSCRLCRERDRMSAQRQVRAAAHETNDGHDTTDR